MKNIVFIVSHLGSGSQILSSGMNKNSRIQVFKTNKVYYHPLSLENLTLSPHKLRNSAAIYLDELLFNFSLCCNNIYEICKFIYLIREPHSTLSNISSYYTYYTPHYAYNYYRHRLRRIYEMAKKTPGAILLTWEDVLSRRGLSLIENYLKLKEPIQPIYEISTKQSADIDLIKSAEITYEKYLYKMKQLKLLTVE